MIKEYNSEDDGMRFVKILKKIKIRINREIMCCKFETMRTDNEVVLGHYLIYWTR